MGTGDVTVNAPVRVLWGRADNGELARIEVMAGPLGALDGYWPPEGLARLDPPPLAEASLTAQVDASDATSLAQMESALGLFAAELLNDVVAVHAAVVRTDAAVLVFPGPSLSGKTSLCVAAIELGHAVLTDEYALVDPNSGLVRGWARPIRIRTSGGWQRFAVVQPHSPCTATLIATLTYSAELGQQPLALTACESSDVVLDLMANTVCARTRADHSLSAAIALARSTPGVRGIRGEAERALPALIDLAAQSHSG